MLEIKKDEMSKFKKTPSVGVATISTHSISLMPGIKTAEFESFLDAKPNPAIKKEGVGIADNTLFSSFIVTEKSTGKKDTVFIGFDGDNFKISFNDNVKIGNIEIPKHQNSIYSHMDEIYEDNNEIPSELSFVFTKFDTNTFVDMHKNWIDYKEEKKLEKTSNIQQEIETPETAEVVNRSNDIVQKATSSQEIPKNIEPTAPQPINTQSAPDTNYVQSNYIPTHHIDAQYKSRLDNFKKQYAMDILKQKNDNKNINFRNIKYPNPQDNPLAKAMMMNAGSKAILCYGPHGSGKTYTAEKYAKEIEEKTGVPVNFFSMLLDKNLDRGDIIGSPVLKNDAFDYKVLSEAFLSARDGNLTVCNLDEIFRLSDISILFNIFGSEHYKLETGRQLEVVELIVEDLNGQLQASHFCLIDKKDLNPDIIIDYQKLKVLKNSDDEMFKRKSNQENYVKEELSHGRIPRIDRADYIKNNLEVLKISSFFTSEVIKAPIDKLCIVATGNAGKDYIMHNGFEDQAYLSRFNLCEMPPATLKDYLNEFERTLQRNKDKGYIMWDKDRYDIDAKIAELTKTVSAAYTQIFKLIKQNSFSSMSKFSYRNFSELADNLSKLQILDNNSIKDCFMSQKLSVMPHALAANTRVATQQDITAYETCVDAALGITKKPTKQATINNAVDNTVLSSATISTAPSTKHNQEELTNAPSINR